MEDTSASMGYEPPPRGSLPGFPGSIKVPGKSRGAGGKIRPRWDFPDGTFGEWDWQHGEVEVYDKRGRHREPTIPIPASRRSRRCPEGKQKYDARIRRPRMGRPQQKAAVRGRKRKDSAGAGHCHPRPARRRSRNLGRGVRSYARARCRTAAPHGLGLLGPRDIPCLQRAILILAFDGVPSGKGRRRRRAGEFNVA
ncbi:hypothetical protein F8237_21750 [Bradyrhizobium betae]|uniref:Colicin E3-like ribonuclease domain-containing protein n=1 Tax=Bradyrhizobium betae TaxID=244734 RepID=A0A5P6P8T5_9BRAD|nr:hypothetical protein F8237_21750 [Bradyrhizobium betae]